MRIAVSCLDIDDFHRGDLVRLAAVDDEAHRFASDEGAVRLAFGVQRVAARRARRLPGLRYLAALEIEHMFIRERGSDDLYELAGRRREPGEPGNAAALLPAIAEDLELDDVFPLVDGRRPIERNAGSPLGLLDVDMGRNHSFLLPSVAPSG